MSTIINTPNAGENSDNFSSTIIGIVIVIILVVLFFVFALPAIRNSNNQNATTPKVQTQDDTLDVNVRLPNTSPTATTTQ